jgi:hypothetical protein
MVKRCEGCDEPEFMCECAKNFQGKRIESVYHKGITIDGQELRHQLYFLRFLPTVIIGKKAFNLICPDRHFEGNVLMGVR